MAVRHLFKSSRAVLSVGFGGLLVIILFMGWTSARAVRSIERESRRLRVDFQERDDLLDGIRFWLAESGSEIRDYLLDRDLAGVSQRRADLQNLRSRISGAVTRYGRELPPDEGGPWGQLTRDINAYWTVVEPSFRWNSAERRRYSQELLSQQVIPRQGELIRLTSAVDRVNRDNVLESNQRILGLFTQFRAAMTASSVLALLLGTLLAFLTIGRILILERASVRQFREVTRARLELQNLSHRLVAAQEEERRRVARELHDEIGQAMSAVLVELGRLENRLPAGQLENRAMVAAARQLADHAVAQARDMALLLRPSMLDDLGLVPALKWQAREVSRRTGVKVRVSAQTVADDLPDAFRTCIYRIVQEAVSNAARHSRATAVRVEARQDEAGIRVSIQDDGGGFDASLEKGMGILGMEERVKELGGEFHIDSRRGRGTTVSLRLPLTVSQAHS